MARFVPSYYEQDQHKIDARCGKLIRPDVDRAVLEGLEYAKVNNLKSTHASGMPDVVLAVIDAQLDFISPDIGNLCVPGAVEDIDRLNRFIYGNIGTISHIVASLDTHYIFQPFHRRNWQAGSRPTVHTIGARKGQSYLEGEMPDPFTIITLSDLDRDAWRPTRLPARMREMLVKLESEGKKQLVIWPFHCILGSPGHAFDPTFLEAMFFHSAARSDQYDATVKGVSQSSEHYGILKAEVEFPDDDKTQLNIRVLDRWEKADRVYFAGQAKSHCVLETLNQVVSLFSGQGKDDVLKKLFVLEDCMSSVPDIKDDRGNVIVPFDDIANARFAELKKMGVKFVKSTDPVSI